MTLNHDGTVSMMCQKCNNVTVLKGIEITNYEKYHVKIEPLIHMDVCVHCKNLAHNLLVQIDEDIVTQICKLNRKGYSTLACCSGHSNDDPGFYVLFEDDTITADPPEHFHYEFIDGAELSIAMYADYDWIFSSHKYSSSDHSELCDIELLSPEEYQKRHKVLLENFCKWVDDLPSLTNKSEEIETIEIDCYK